jgi:ribonuclease P protein component
MTDFRFPKQLHLLKPADFRRVLDARRMVSDHSLRIGGVANSLNHPRLGLTVSRKVGGAVTRNRWKRVLREAFRLTQHELPPLDLVCIPVGSRCPELRQLVATLPALANRLDKQLRRASTQRNDEMTPPSERVP